MTATSQQQSDDWPMISAPLQLAEHDGDMQQLRELSDRLFNANPTGGGPIPVAVITAQAVIAVAKKIGCTLNEVLDTQQGAWPADRVPAMLADWPTPVICKVVCP